MSSPHSGVFSRTENFAHPKGNVVTFGIDHGMKVADFGAGSGAYVMAIAEQLGDSGTVYAIDVQKDLLRRIKNEAHAKHHKNVEIIWADLEVPGASMLADSSMHVVLISNLLFQLVDKRPPLVEAHRILRPKGKLIIIDWSESFGGLGPIKDDVVPKEAALELARDAGFEFMREIPVGAHHYGLLLRPSKD